MSFTQFIKPYPDGYEDFEVGGTPVTAEILNTNYDGFLLGLNEFLPELAGMVEANPSESATAGNLTKLKVGNSIYLIPSGGSGGSTVVWEQLQLTGTKIATITIDNVPVDVYAPSGGSGDEVEWTQEISSGTKIGTITINDIPIDVYTPTPIDVEANPSGSATAGDLTKLKVGSGIYSIPSGGSGGSGHTILDDDGTALAQEDDLQFKGVYTADNSEDGVTEVNVYREMTKAEFNALSSDEKKGFIRVIDEPDTASIVDGVFIDTGNVVKDDFTIDSTAHDWIATEDCIVFGLLQANDQYTSAYFNIDGESAFVTLNATTGETTYIPVKKGQTLTYRSKSGTYTRIKAYGIQQGSKTLPWVELTDTLEAGETSLTFTNEYITTNSVIDYYTDTFGVEPTDITVSAGSVVLIFDEQENDLGVKVRIS